MMGRAMIYRAYNASAAGGCGRVVAFERKCVHQLRDGRVDVVQI
jgi:hypothetical protein